ncbi:M20 metallopeptidase family protein [Sciscionella marina]|uniref:M20 metallopeptidase family protein n=1 Tax=Sciscionella marina TaxID=508770 RepID=UPI0003637792|nr:M20 family metallopeptidase [Sciscionella marina]
MNHEIPLGAFEEALAGEIPAAVELRHRIHAEPDLGGAEERTAALVASELGVPDAPRVTEGRLIRVDVGTGPAVALRAELDGLPITETTHVPWAAHNGAMHACGHDVHLAALVAVVRTVRRVGGTSPLLAVLQPREESLPCGAKDMIESPLLVAEPVGAFFGTHVQAALPAGTIAAQPGPVNAASDEFTVRVAGRPGHGAYPHTTADPVVAASAVVSTLHQLVSRRVDPMHPTVLTVGSISGGSAANAVAEQVTLTGTLRTFDSADRHRLHELIRDTSELTARANGCTATTDLALGEPVLDNDPALVESIVPLLTDRGFTTTGDHRSCGADDFAYYGELFPTLMCFVGVDAPAGIGLHHPAFLPPDAAVTDVARAMLAGYVGACRYLSATTTEVTP